MPTAPEESTGKDVKAQYPTRLQSTIEELQQVNGFVVWSSNRYGSHDILKMNLPGRQIAQLTSNPASEYFPRVSPDGSQVLFARSREGQTSQRNLTDWNIILLDLDSAAETLVATNATFPEWIDNTTVSYLYQGTQVVIKTIGSSDAPHVVHASGQSNMLPEDTLLFTPQFNPKTEHLVFTGRQSRIGMNGGAWGTAVMYNDGTHKGLYNGCQLFFSSNHNYMYQVTSGGKHDKKGNRFMKIDIESHERTELFDFDDDYSHIYFPKDSNDGQYMVFGGSRGDHEHDEADYEIFLWDMDKPPGYATRLTFHSGNDNWPDIYIHQ
ncbi:MAG: TolB family protein [Granulosicoccus sp.]